MRTAGDVLLAFVALYPVCTAALWMAGGVLFRRLEEPTSVEEPVGQVGPERRSQLMSRAHALLAPTLYVEPFGGVVAEAAFCGTPAVTTDWGAFTETVQQGVTGWRCRTLAEFCEAAERAGELDPEVTRRRAEMRWSMDAVAPQYGRYFARLKTLRRDGWCEKYGGRKHVTL